MIKFSIAIPAYKANYIKECINSVLSQTYPNFELIIINDDSPYDLDTIINGFHDKRIKYYKNKQNIGAINVVDNWNKCLSYASGNYFICIGDDDKLKPNYLMAFLGLIKRYPDLNVFHCRSFIIDENSHNIQLTPSCPEWESVYEYIWHIIKFYRYHFIGDYVFNTNFLKKMGGFYKITLAWGSDDITSFIAANDKGIAHIQYPVFCYRMNTHSITSSGSIPLKIKAFEQEREWYRKFLISHIPNNEIDIVMKNNIEKELNKYFSIFTNRLIIDDIQNFKDLISYIFSYKKYNMTYTDIAKILIKYLQKKFTRK